MLSPLPASKWNFTTAAHLLNRAGFGGPPAEIQALEKLGLDGAVERLVDYEKIPDPTAEPEWAKPDPERIKKFQELKQGNAEQKKKIVNEERKTQRQRIVEMRGAWLA